MAHPVIVQDATLRQFTRSLAGVFSLPQWKYFVIVLLGLLHGDAAHTLSGMLRQVTIAATVSGLSRFLQHAPWSVAALTAAREVRFKAEVAADIAQAHAAQRAHRPRRPGRPCETVVTGFLILDDSTHVKRYAAAMEGQGWHYSTTEQQRMPGHSLFQSVYCLLGRQLPLTPQLYRQKTVCQRTGVPFQSKVDLAVQTLQTFEPPADTHTHVLVDSWYVNKALWQTARHRGWDFSGGLKSNRQLRRSQPDGQRVWLSVADYARDLASEDFQPVNWPNQDGGRRVWAHLVRTRVKKLGACQVLVVKFTPDAPASQFRFWVTSRLADTLDAVVAAVAMRWAIETLFADLKELLGSDQYQVRSAQAIVRFWALALCLYQYLDEQRVRLRQECQRPVSLGEARTWVRQRHTKLLFDWLAPQFAAGATADQVCQRLKPALA